MGRTGGLPSNVKTGYILITDLSQQLKAQRDFLKWMARRYAKLHHHEQSEAFATGARLFDELRNDLLAGLFNVDEAVGEKEVFTEETRAGLDELPDEEFLRAAREVHLNKALDPLGSELNAALANPLHPINDRIERAKFTPAGDPDEVEAAARALLDETHEQRGEDPEPWVDEEPAE